MLRRLPQRQIQYVHLAQKSREFLSYCFYYIFYFSQNSHYKFLVLLTIISCLLLIILVYFAMSAIPAQPIGQSDSFHALLDRVSDAASLDRPVIVVGERGTGKEMIASRLHFLSPRWEAQFVKVNCAAFSDEMLDRELFGETFMDGRDDTNGRFYEADGGTIFLDNIETLSPRLQEKLMRAVEYGEYEAGGEAPVSYTHLTLPTTPYV